MEPVRAKKHLGQHFLKDENIARKIAESLSPGVSQVLEVGPGTGVLTKYLIANHYSSFKAIELDRESAAYLKSAFTLGEDLIHADFLRTDISALFEGPFAVIGNFPYNISSQIFFKVVENRDKVSECVGMIQREVAQRMVSKPGTKDYGILSILLRAWYDIEILFIVPPQVFVPPPKVTSAVVKLTRNGIVDLGCDTKLFSTVVKTAFNQRRKTLHNSLKPLADYNGEFTGKRAEQLSISDFVTLTNDIAETCSQ
ncbi:MAG TPA: 16S rRNA (adenine(1518)-N(6)/adenine(1519)-N(6))-dimethyltransferase RsmA [Bacteroidales bacterium]|nr:16S rRNA (adenine(1518)-N(6)/adenine(1519)-N(6))-dimethyltransferase RsmA [Bacteroidales bacterium]HPT02886.1 16S rRNA (adenine(1518)-N(6)/adenine(1519)-N(6))-dimethyltransferase RsmA [Bacteroidales bacterium]